MTKPSDEKLIPSHHAEPEIPLAVAPHGALAPELLPAQIKTPAGNSDLWWLAIYK